VRASRLVNLLLLLQARGGLTAAQIAGELEVSVRTVHRDVDALAEAGVPIYAERGPHGGIRLVDGYRTRLTGVTEEEAEALFLSGVPGPAAELGLGRVVAAGRLKVLAALPPELRSRAARLGQRFHLDAPGWFQQSEGSPCLGELATAVWEDRRVRIRYDRGDRDVERVLEPMGLVLKGGVWYMVARVDGQLRTYRASRVRQASVTQERFDRADDFDLATFWAESTAAYEQAVERVVVTLRIDPRIEDDLSDALGPRAAGTVELVAAADASGWQRLRVSLEWPAEAHLRLLRFGALVEVLEPQELRERIAREARAVLDRYLTPRSTSPASAPVPGSTVGPLSR
jgi:predicted DNA-binding transcriptional regulator YafY